MWRAASNSCMGSGGRNITGIVLTVDAGKRPEAARADTGAVAIRFTVEWRRA